MKRKGVEHKRNSQDSDSEYSERDEEGAYTPRQ